ncbi:MAG: hypothetical protein HY471_02220 [Candidatus Sungbacteria bacterium]|nr:hypothetical protein [Candidatus Sungbacteria bacterium]
MNTFLLQVVIAFIYGFFNDFSDLLDEHGLRWFPGATVLTGIIWAVAGVLLMISYPPIAMYEIGILLFWLVAGKLDYFNHQLAAAIIFITAFWQFQQGMLSLSWVVLSFLIIWGLSLLAKRIKRKYGNLAILHIRHFVVPAVLSFLVGNPLPSLLHGFAMLGCFLSDRWFVAFEKHQKTSWYRRLGFSIMSSP